MATGATWLTNLTHAQQLPGFEYLEDVGRLPGIVDLAEAFAAGSSIDWRECLLEIRLDPFNHPISLITAGRKDDQFVRRLQDLDWERLFDQYDFGSYLETLRKEWIKEFDYVLIDSRTGITDTGGICTIYLPDVLVVLFTANKQSLEGVIDVVRRARKARTHLPFDRGHLFAVPVPCRDESRTEYEQALEWRHTFFVKLSELYRDFLPREIDPADALELLRIPHVPYWSFGERLPVVNEGTKDPSSISFYYAVLARLLGSGLQWSYTSALGSAPSLRGSYLDTHEARDNLRDVVLLADELRRLREDAFAASPRRETRPGTGLLRSIVVPIILAIGVYLAILGSAILSQAQLGLSLAISGLILAVVSFLWLHRRQAMQNVVEKQPLLHHRDRMLKRVRHRWVDGVLERSLKNQIPIALGLNDWPDSVQPRRELWSPGRTPRLLSAGTAVSEVFDAVDGRLFILGPPGSGKTTALLELTRDLLNRASQDLEQPIPVVFNLSSWGQHQLPLADWLVEELYHSYEMPRWVAEYWVSHDYILPLLDGLDEIAEASHPACVTAIGRFLSEHRVNFVVCSRTDEYQSLVILRLEDAVILQSLTRQQVDRYLVAVGDPLANIREALKADDSLWELLQSLFMLNLVTLAYQGKTADMLRAPGTLEQRRARLFADFTERMFTRRPLVDHRYTKAQAIHWLSRLAQSMQERSQSEFDLDRLQPDWLPRTQRRLVTLIPALFVGLVGGLAGGLVTKLLVDSISGSAFALKSTLVFGLVFGLVSALGALGSGRAFKPVEPRRWSSVAVRIMVLSAGLVVGLLVKQILGLDRGFGTGLLLALVVIGIKGVYGLLDRYWEDTQTIEPVEPIYPSGPKRGFGSTSLRIVGRFLGLVIGGVVIFRVFIEVTGLGIGLNFLVGAVMVSEVLSDLVPKLAVGLTEKGATLSEGIRRSARRGLATGVATWLVIWLIVWLIAWLGLTGYVAWQGIELRPALLFGLLIGLLFGLFAGLESGGIAFLRHLTLRSLLVLNRVAPWRYVDFLDDMTERLFLSKSGGSYIFRHPLLHGYFAEPPLSEHPTVT